MEQPKLTFVPDILQQVQAENLLNDAKQLVTEGRLSKHAYMALVIGAGCVKEASGRRELRDVGADVRITVGHERGRCSMTHEGAFTTLKAVREHKPRKERWATLLYHLGKRKADDEPLALATILESNGIADAIWCLRALGEEYRPSIIRFACDCAESVLFRFEDKFPADRRPRQAIAAARLVADAPHSKAWEAARAAGEAAAEAAGEAAEAAEAAGETAWSAAWSSARAAEATAEAVEAAGEAAGSAAWWAVEAAEAAGGTAWSSARAAENEKQAQIFRKYFCGGAA